MLHLPLACNLKTKILPITPQQALVTINNPTRLATAAAMKSLQ
jgi:hypothetical protein